jgi:VanZ family protein
MSPVLSPKENTPSVSVGKIPAALLRLACGFVLAGILTAGLWPFHTPRNEVSWSSDGRGLVFGKHGTAISEGAFRAQTSNRGPCSIEVWLKPNRIDWKGMILAFYHPGDKHAAFSLRQYAEGVVYELNTSASRRIGGVYGGPALDEHRPTMVSLISDGTTTTIYANGAPVRKATDFPISSRDLTGRLILGNSPVSTYEWSGAISALAIYDRALTADEVVRHYESQKNGSYANAADDRSLVAFYPFNERSGNAAHNLVDSSTDLLIPERFLVLNKPFLERPWDEFHNTWSYYKDALINVAGFIPLGLCFYAYSLAVRKSDQPGSVIAFGFVVSATIEVLQGFLPTRDSGMTDLFTNTLGTAIGVAMCRWAPVQTIFAWFGISIRDQR